MQLWQYFLLLASLFYIGYQINPHNQVVHDVLIKSAIFFWCLTIAAAIWEGINFILNKGSV